ncbi:MAG: hypothetical protein AB2690_21125 [Candidatus Thiodiazotropha endolucinida]
MNELFGKRGFTLTLGSILILLSVVSCSFFGGMPVSTSKIHDYEKVRQEILNQYHKAAELPEKYKLKAIPSFSAGGFYSIGSVFIDDYFPLRFTNKCVVKPELTIKKVQLPAFPQISNNNSFEITAKLPETLSKALDNNLDFNFDVKANKLASFSYVSDTADTVDIDVLGQSLLNEDCLKLIANRDILVVASIFHLKEIFKSGKALDNTASEFYANAKVKFLKEDSIVFKYTKEGSFSVEDDKFLPRAWALIPMSVNVPGYDVNGHDDDNTQAIINALRIESGSNIEVSSTSKDLSMYTDKVFNTAIRLEN